jgi:hypothetical protein
MYLAAAFLEFDIYSLNAFYRESHHCLVSDLRCEYLVVDAGDMQIGLAAVDPCVGWWGFVAKRFFEAADLRPLIQRLRGVGGRQNGNRAFDDRFH